MNKKEFTTAMQPFMGRVLTQEEEARAVATAYEAMDGGAVTPEECDSILAGCPNFCRCPSVGDVWEYEQDKKKWEEETGAPYPGGLC